MPALSSIALGVGAAGALGGAISGAQGRTQTSTSNIPEAGPQERQLQQDAIAQYLQQRRLIDEQQAGLSQLDPFRTQALQGLQGIASGQAFQATPEELANINALRQAQIQLGTQDFSQQFQDLANRTNASAGIRGLRGQALGELQGQNLRTMGSQIGNIVNTAGVQAAQSAIENPYRRVAAQMPALQTGLTYQDELRQRAIQNRQLASNPALLGYFQQGRMANQSTTQRIPGGGIAGAIGGGVAGFGGGFNNAVQGLQGFNELRNMRWGV